MDDVIALTKRRLATMAAGEKFGSDAISKSLRCYETKVHPVLSERLSVWLNGLDKRSVTQGRTFLYNRDVAGMPGSRFMNYVLQSFYEQEPGAEVEVIYPKLSRRTSTDKTSATGLDMLHEVTKWLECHQSEDLDEPTVLRDLAKIELTSTIVEDLLDNTLNSSLTRGICDLLFRNEFTFPSDEFLTVEGRRLNRSLRMKVKYYPSRDDNRAYCSDHSRLRSLVASCLNRMIAPKSMSTRLNLHSACFLRPDKKDVLDLHIPDYYDERVATYLVTADISNFTGSFANAWLMTFVMGLELDQNERLEDRYQLFSIGDYFIKASWKELLILYVYLTVGVPCWIEDLSRFGYLSGGFLGVGGNISIGLLCLAVVLQNLFARLKPEIIDYRAQAGGDDVALILRCMKADQEEISNLISNELEAYVGKLKEFEVFDLDELDDGVIQNATFCRKRITLKRDRSGIHLTGEPSVPLPSSLFPFDNIIGLQLQIQAWRELDYSLRGYEAKCPGNGLLTDTLRQLFLERYRRVYPVRRSSKKHLTSSHGLLRFGSTLITTCAHSVVLTVRPIRVMDSIALSNYESQLRHALIREKVTLIYVDNGEEGTKPVVMTKAEARLLHRSVWTERVHIGFDEELLDRLLNIVNS